MNSATNIMVHAMLNPRVVSIDGNNPRRFLLRFDRYPTDADYPALASHSFSSVEVRHSFMELELRRRIDERVLICGFADLDIARPEMPRHSWNTESSWSKASHIVTGLRVISPREVALELARRLRRWDGAPVTRYEMVIEIFSNDRGQMLLDMMDNDILVGFSLRFMLSDRHKHIKTPFRVRLVDVQAFCPRDQPEQLRRVGRARLASRCRKNA